MNRPKHYLSNLELSDRIARAADRIEAALHDRTPDLVTEHEIVALVAKMRLAVIRARNRANDIPGQRNFLEG